MSSTFMEMYSDFQDTAKLYVEKLDVTEVAFMRFLTRGIQIFQLDTEYVEKNVRLTPDANGDVYVPEDLKRYIEIKAIKTAVTNTDLLNVLNSNESYHVTFLSPTQYFRARNVEVDGKMKVPYPNIWLRQPGKTNYIATIWDMKILTYPEWKEDFYFRYIPDLKAFGNNQYWTQADDLTTAPPTYNSWYPLDEVLAGVPGGPMTRFFYQFSTKRLHPFLQQYEQAFIEYALSQFIRAKGNANYRVFMDTFLMDVERAKRNKPTLFQEGDPYYMYAPFS